MRTLLFVVGSIFAAGLSAPAGAQSMSPMTGEVKSVSDSFAVRVFPANPYNHRIKVNVAVYDQDFRPVVARVTPREFMLGSQVSRPVMVIIPFEGNQQRKVRICTESIPFPGQGTQVRAQICGKFLGEQRF
jgi:hypothetical protein